MAKKLDNKFFIWEKKTPDAPLLRQPFGDRWEEYSWSQTGDMARSLAAGLLSLNLPPKSHIGIISKNCREWIIADLAIMTAGFVSVPMYPTLTAEEIKEIVIAGDVRAIFAGKLENADGVNKGVPSDIPIINFPQYEDCAVVERGMEWKSLVEGFEPLEDLPDIYTDDIWTIVFTSGTTGSPKGVVLTYEAFERTEIVTEELNPLKISKEGDNRFFSYLPLNHIAERIVVEATCLRYGGSISFTESLNTFGDNLRDAQPTVFLAVPRIWTKFQLGILSNIPEKKLDRMLKIPIISRLIKTKIKKSLGLHKTRVCTSGAAPMSSSLKNWYRKLGLPIGDGYGLTESCALGTSLDKNDNRQGSVGKAQPGTKIKIDDQSGEIMMSASYHMSGYYKNPELTRKVLKDGWLMTGDQGYLDDEGYLYITGRVKDTFKTSKGKFIVPGPLEWKLGANNDIEQVCVDGLGCPQPLALVVLSSIGRSKDRESLQASLSASLNSMNEDLPNYQKISTIVICKEDWDAENGLLTPTLKIKRTELRKKYGRLMEVWHHESSQILWEK